MKIPTDLRQFQKALKPLKLKEESMFPIFDRSKVLRIYIMFDVAWQRILRVLDVLKEGTACSHVLNLSELKYK